MANNVIEFPEARVKTENAIKRFKLSENFKIPMVLSVLNGTHITTAAPDKKSWLLQQKTKRELNPPAFVGGDLRFLSVLSGYLVSLHDSQVLRNWNLFHRPENGAILNVPTAIFKNKEISSLLVADSAYCLKSGYFTR